MSEPELDPHSGTNTTGHEWNGIKELNTPIPKIVWFFYGATTLVAMLLWVLFPTWPTGNSYTPGVLGVDQRTTLDETLIQSAAQRAEVENRIALASFDVLRADPEISDLVTTHGARLFSDNCAGCHNISGTGNDGFPSLVDADWLWGGGPEDIMETLRVGINSNHPETRRSQMLAFGDIGILDRAQRADTVAYVLSLQKNSPAPEETKAQSIERGAEVFETQCASCHGDNAKGNQDLGAPNLTDDIWLYGGTAGDLDTTINHGRQGVMPYWDGRLSANDRKILAAYLYELKEQQ